MPEETARDTQESCTRLSLRGSQALLARLRAVAIIVAGGFVIALGMIAPAPATAQSTLPTIAIKAPTTSTVSPSTAPTANEGTTLTWTVTRTGSTSSELTVPFEWRDRGAGDYNTFFEFTENNPKVTSVTFPAGMSEVTLSVETDNDELWERNTVLMICISVLNNDGDGLNYQAPFWFNCAGFNLVNDDDPPLVTITSNQATISEGGRPSFTLTRHTTDLSRLESVRVTIKKVESNGNVSNYSLSPSLTFQPNQASLTYHVRLRDNDTRSDDDFFTLRVIIASPEPAPGAPNGTYRIAEATRKADVAVEDDDLPRISVSAPISQSEAQPVVFTFTRVDSPLEPLTIDLSFTQGGDYLPPTVPSTLTFEARVLSKELTFPVDDGVDEINGGVILTLASTDLYVVEASSQNTIVLLIDDDEPQFVTIERDSVSVVEGEDATFRLTRQFSSGGSLAATGQAMEWPLVVNVAVTEVGHFVDGTAPSSVTFAAGSGTATLTVPTIDDVGPQAAENRFHSAYEDDGSITVTILSGTNYTSGLPLASRTNPEDPMSNHTLIVQDNEPPLVRATVVANLSDDVTTNHFDVMEGSQLTVYIKRYFYDDTEGLTVHLHHTNLTCAGSNQPGEMPRDLVPAENPFGETGDLTFTASLGPGENSTVVALSTQQDNASECDLRWSVEIVPPPAPEGVTPGEWMGRYNEWDYHPLRPTTSTVTMTDNDVLPVISFTSPTVNEDAGNAVVLASLRTAVVASGYESSWPIVLHWWTIPRTATETQDYNKIAEQSVTFPADSDGGAFQQQLTIPINDNHTPEGTETFQIGYRLSTFFDDDLSLTLQGAVAEVTIIDNDQIPTISAGVDIEVQESVGTVSVPIMLDQASDIAVVVNWTTEDGTAKSGAPPLDDDYVAATGSYTFVPGSTVGHITIAIRDDSNDETTIERFIVRLTSITNGVLGRAATNVAIIDNDQLPYVVLNGIAGGIPEAVGTAEFSIDLLNDSFVPTVSGKQVTLTFAVADGRPLQQLDAANLGSDYTVPTATLTIPAGTLGGTFRVTVIDDDTDEVNEFFAVSITNIENGRQFPNIALRTFAYIIDDDLPPTVSIEDGTISEPSSETGTLTIQIPAVLERASDKTVLVRYRTADGTAQSVDAVTGAHDDDYESTSGTLTFAPGETIKNIPIIVNGDYYVEPDEQFTISTLPASEATWQDGTGVVTIQDSSRLPVIFLESISPGYRVSEAFGEIQFFFTLNHPDDIGLIASGRVATIDYQIKPYTPESTGNIREAIRGTDYHLPASGTLTFQPGSTVTSVVIPLVDDRIDEPIERFIIGVDNPVNATYTDRTEWTIAILDDDSGSKIDVFDAEVRENLGPMRFNVVLDKQSGRDVSFNYNTQQGTAFVDEDYEQKSDTVTIAAGTTSARIEITITNDNDREPIQEQFTLFLRNAVNGTLVDSTAVGYIIDDDQELPVGAQTEIVVSSAEVTVPEGNATGTSIDVRLLSAPNGSVVVTLSGASNTALMVNPTSLTFDSSTWQTDQTVTFTAASDQDAEDEVINIRLAAAGGGYQDVARSVRVTVEDDDTAGITTSQDALTINELESGEFTVRLNSEPVAPVTVTISKSAAPGVNLAAIRLSATSLDFTLSDWQTAQTVTVEARDDSDASNEAIMLDLIGFGTGYAGLKTSVSVTTSDDDTAGLVLLDSGGDGLTTAFTMTERESIYITVALASAPTASVDVTASVVRLTELTLDTDNTPGTKTLTFGAQDWNVPQRIDLVSLGDDDAIQAASIPVSFSTTGGDYSGLTVPDLTVTVTETDAAGLVFSADPIAVNEGDSTGTSYSVRLSAQPLGDGVGTDSVTLAVSPSAGSGLTAAPTSLTFNTSDWNVVQTVTVTAASDGNTANSTGVLTHTASGATEYVGVTADVAVNITNSDVPALVITPSPLSVNEGGMATYRVRLATEPTGDVEVVVSGHSSTDFSLDETSLTFTSINWSTPQGVQVSVGHDDDAISDDVELIHTATGSDYGGVTASVTVRAVEDEEEALIFSPPKISLAEGTEGTFSVALASRPTTVVTVDISAPGSNGFEFDKTSLTFSATDWQTAQSVTITSPQDVDASDENLDVRLEIGSGTYGAPTILLHVTVVDDDSVDIVLSDSSLSIAEGVRTTYSVRLATRPSETVTIDIDVPVGAEIAVLPPRLSISADNWMTEQTVTVVASRDLDADVDPAITVTHTARNGDYDMVMKTMTVVVSEADVRALVFLDSIGGTVDPSESLEIDEGGRTSYSVRLETEPSSAVVVTLSPTESALSPDGTSFTFAPSDWFTAQTVSVTASHDEDASVDAAVIAHSVAGGGYDSVARSLDFLINDDDSAAILLTDTSGIVLATEGFTVTEGAAASYRVQLATEPSATVTVVISGTANTDLTTGVDRLTFTDTNWNTPQTVEVNAGHDDDAVADADVTLRHVASGGGYGSVTADLAVVIAEDDSDGFILTDAAGDPVPGNTLVVNEGGNAAYKISLSAEPAGPVTVSVSGVANTDLQLNKTELTFTAANWSTPQTVTATAAHDADAVDDPVALVHTPSGAGYAAPVLGLNAVIDDDDQQSVVVSVGSLDIPEGTTASVTVSLGTAPTGDVVVELVLSAGAELDLPVTELTFTAQNWMTTQDVSIVSLHDNDTSDDAAQIGFNADGSDYDNVLAILGVTIRDDDMPGMVLNEDSLEVTEGSSADFTIRLATQPSETVTVTIGGNASTNLTLRPTRLFFTSADWNTAQAVTATAAHDVDIDAETIELNLAARDADYDAVADSVTVTIIDDDPAVTVSFAQAAYSVTEGSSVSVEVRLSEAPGRTVAVTITAAPASPTVAGDYTVPTSVSFAATETSKTITFEANHDSDDDDESVTLGFGSSLPAGVSAGSQATTVVTIDDDDPTAVTVSFAQAAYSVTEGSSVSVEVRLSEAPGRTVAVTITAAPASPTVAGDYTVPVSVSFTGTETSKTITFEANHDSDDDDESVTLGFGSSLPAGVSAGSQATTVVTIDDDDPTAVTVSFAQAAYSVTEGSSVSVEVRLSEAPGRTVAVTITAAPASPTVAGDYTVPVSVSFTGTETSKTITFEANHDSDDDDESVTLGFGSSLPAGVSAGSQATTVVTIDDDDPTAVTVSFAQAAYSVTEGSSVSVEVRLSEAPGRTVAVTITAAPASPTVAGDYTVPVSVSFTGTETSKTITFEANHDSDDDDESVTLGFGSSLPAGVSAGSQATTVVTIDDDDPTAVTVSFAQAAYSVTEGSSVSVEVRLSEAPGRTVAVTITAAPASPTVAGDYTVPVSVSFTGTETSKTITFEANHDSDDDDESVTLGFGSSLPAGVSAGSQATTVVTIDDDDPTAVTVSFAQAAYSVTEGSSVSVEVRLSEAPGRTVAVTITAAPASPTVAGDYTVPVSVSFTGTETSKTITFEANHDSDDDDESVTLGFGSSLPAGVSAGSQATTVVTIDDDDPTAVTVSFAQAAYSVTEGSSVSVEVRLSEAPGRTVAVTITAAPASPTVAGDYTVPVSVSFTGTETSKTITFEANHDSDDDDESVTLGFGSSLPAGVSAGSQATTVVTIDDDDPTAVTVSFAQAAYSVTEGSSVSVEVRLSEAPGRTVAVTITAAPASPTVAGDYTVPVSVSFTGTETSKTITFEANHDSDDDDESVTLGFGSSLPAGVSAGSQATTVVTIDDDDPTAVTVSFAQAAYSVTEGSSVSVEVRLSEAPGRTVAVTITAAPASPTVAGDYTVPVSVSFTGTETSKTITFEANHDSDDDDESVTLGFGSSLPAGVSAGSQATTVVTIDDDDPTAVTVSFAQAAYSVTEGSSVSVEVRLSEAPGRTVAVTITAAPASPTVAGDYTVPVSVSFTGTETSKTITFEANHDSDDDDESVTLGFGSSLPAGVSAGSQATTVVTIDDDDPTAVTVSFAQAAYSVTEGSSVSVEVRLSEAPGRTVAVTITAAPASPTVAGDYTVPVSVSFTGTETSKTITFEANHDSDDDDESVTLGFGSSLPAGVSAGSQATTVVTIDDDDPTAVTVSFAQAAYSVTEGSSVSVEVRLSEAPGRTVAVTVTAAPASPTVAGDYTVPVSVSFTGTETSKTITFEANHDSDDDDESVTLGFGSSLPAGVSAGSQATTVVTIDDDDPTAVTVSFAQAAYSVTEGASVSVEVRLSEAPGRTVAVTVTAAPASPTVAGDYTVPVSVSFTGTETSKTITFEANHDSDDDDESVTLGFGSSLPAGVSAGSQATTVVTIDDDDPTAVTVSFAQAAYSVTEGSSVSVEVRLSEAPGRTVAVTVTAAPASPTVAGDYTVPVSVSFTGTETSKTITFEANHDSDDDDESVTLGFGSSLPAGVSAGSQATTVVTIDDDDPTAVTVSFAQAAYSVTEGVSVSVEVRLSEAPGRTVAVTVTAVPASPTVAGDYTVPVSVSFAATETSKTIAFEANHDSDDDDESVTLGFGSSLPAGVSAGSQATTVVTIDDDDPTAVTVSFAQAAYSVTEGVSVSVEVRLSEAPGRTVAVTITAAPASPTVAGDYTVPVSVSFTGTETSKTITFEANHDSDDDDESVTLGFGSSLPAGVSAGSQATTVVTIDDDDPTAVTVSFAQAAYSVTEGSSVSVEVRLSEAPGRTVAVTITAAPASPTVAGDYTVPVSVSFTGTETSKTITFEANHDSDDDDESVTLGFGSSLPAGVSAGSQATTVVTIDDDDPTAVTVSFAQAAYSVTEGSSVSVEVRLSEAPGRTVAVTITAAPASPTVAGDYTVPVSVSFTGTETSKTITFEANHDSDDDDESVTLGFGSSLPAGVSAGSQATTVVTIDDDDPTAVTVSFAQAAYSVTEGSSVSVEVRLSEAPGRTVAVTITAAPASPTVAGDYTVPVSVSFTGTETSKTITFEANHDSDDDDESVTLGFGSSLPAGVSAGSQATTVVTIDDDDPTAVTVSFAQAAYSVTEGVSVSVEVRLSEAPGRTVAVTVTAAPASPTVAGDYTVPVSVSFTGTETSKTIAFEANHDSDDDDESVTLGFGSSLPAGVSAGSQATTVVTIDDDDPTAVTVSFAQAAYSVTEGVSVSVEVRLSEAPGRTVAVTVTAVPASPTVAGDYTVPTSVSFAATETSKTIAFAANHDSDDDDESVTLGFGSSLPAGVSAGSQATTVVTIDDDDPTAVTVSFAQAAYSVTEGVSVSVEVRLSEAPGRTVAVTVTAVPASPTVAGDYTVPVSVSFAATETSKTIAFAANHDSDDDDESVTLGFGSSLPAGVSAGSQATTVVTIDDDDPTAVTVSFAQAAYSVTEGVSVSVEVRLSEAPGRTVAVTVTAAPASPTVAGDYTVPTSVSFAATETSKTIAFAANHDSDDDDESVTLGFGSSLPAGVSAGSQATTVVTIDDDDPTAVTVSFAQAAYSVTEGVSVSVEVRLSEAPGRTVAVTVTAVPASPTVAGDYTVPTSVSFAATETSKTIAFAANHDSDDDDESVTLGFGSSLPAGVSAGSQATTVVTIDDDDPTAVTVSFAQAAYSVTEGVSVSVEVRLSEAPGRTVAVTVTAVPASPTVAGDYTVPTSVSFAATETSKTIAFAANHDSDDDDESVTLGFGSSLPAGVSAGSQATTVVTIDDDDDRQRRGFNDQNGIVVTIEQVPDGSAMPYGSSAGDTVGDGSTFVEGTWAAYRLVFTKIGAGLDSGVVVGVRYTAHNDSPIVSTHGAVSAAEHSPPMVEVWDTVVEILDNDIGNPDGTLTITITECKTDGCVIGTPSRLTVTITDNDGGPAAAPPGPPDQPTLVCASSGGGYDPTGMTLIWDVPSFVGGAPVLSYELRYRQTAEFTNNKLILYPWEHWPRRVAASAAMLWTDLTGLTQGLEYTVQVRAVNANGSGRWSEPGYWRVGLSDEMCDIRNSSTDPRTLN